MAFEEVDLVESESKLLFAIEHVLLKLLERESRYLCRHVLGVVQKLLELSALSILLRLAWINLLEVMHVLLEQED